MDKEPVNKTQEQKSHLLSYLIEEAKRLAKEKEQLIPSTKRKMKKKIYKWFLIGIGAILLILIITNPSNESYTQYLRANGCRLDETKEYHVQPYWGRESNYFIFSKYKYNDGYDVSRGRKEHFGILGNFYELE